MIKTFFENLRNSDEVTKKIWLVVLSGTAMLVIVGFWVLNLKSQIGTGADAASSKEGEDKPGFLTILSNGLKVTSENLKNKLSQSASLFIQNSERNFVLENLKPVPKTSLP